MGRRRHSERRDHGIRPRECLGERSAIAERLHYGHARSTRHVRDAFRGSGRASLSAVDVVMLSDYQIFGAASIGDMLDQMYRGAVQVAEVYQ